MNFARTAVALVMLTAAVWQIPAVAAQTEPRDISPTSEVASRSVSERSDPWRYKYHDGRWWYWLPSSSWVFYHNQRWVPYSRQNYSRSLQADRAAGRQGVAYRGFEDSTSANPWPRGDNGSSPYASPQPGGARVGAVDRRAAPPSNDRWPRGNNGSSPYASPQPGGAPVDRNEALPPRGRWPRDSNGSGPNSAPRAGGAPANANRNRLPPKGRWPRDSNGSGPNSSPQPGGAGAESRSP